MRASPLTEWALAHLATFDPLAELRATREGCGLYDAGGRDRVLVVGAGRVGFLQGLCTNDVDALSEGHALEAAFVTAQGKLVADARVVKLEDGLLLDAEPGRGAALDELWTRHRVHEDAQWLDVSESLSALELWGPRAAAVLEGDPLADGEGRAASLAGASFAALGSPFGAVLYLPADAAIRVAEALLVRGARVVGEATREARRIGLGLGRYGLDWDQTHNPLEAGLERAISYRKGCYVGQEVVAKATYVGHVNRRLVRLEWEEEPVAPGTALLGARTPGRVTSAAWDPLSSRTVALGMVRREVAAAGSRLRVGTEAGPEATVVGVPFGSRPVSG